tara:strand:+ start:21459 stop:22421 length:963 start_codon:yes stop_codon:yes gene_type:complete
MLRHRSALDVCGTLALFTLVLLSTAAAVHADEVVDQTSPASNSDFYCSDPVNVWQQQIRAGIGGRLQRIELVVRGPIGAEVDVRLRPSSAWSTESPVWSTHFVKSAPGNETVQFDVESANLILAAGDTFVVELQGNDTGAEVKGSYVHPTQGAPNYTEPLMLTVPGTYQDGGWRIGFRTWMETDLSQPVCVSTANSSGSAATLAVTGSFDLAVNDLVLRAGPAPVGQPGFFVYGPESDVVLLGDGILCVGGGALGIARLPIEFVDGAGQLMHPLDVQAPPTAAFAIAPGSTWVFQAWFRDPAAGGTGFNLSDGLEITFLP